MTWSGSGRVGRLSTDEMFRISRVLETCLYATDLAAMERFYGKVLGLPKMVAEYPRHVFFRVGPESMLLIFNPVETIKEQEVPSHGAHGPAHIAFAVEGDDLDECRAHLAEHGVAIEREIQWPGGGRSIYFRDPAGNSVEFATRRTWE